ncbi:MAG: YSC84-related protein [Phycisphaeraceae bacterium]
MWHKSIAAGIVIASVGLWSAGCSDYKQQEGAEHPQATQHSNLEGDARVTIETFKGKDPSMQKFFDTSHGYAVFPEVAKGGAGIGGAHGEGVVYQQGKVVGYTTLSQATLGVQLGGQTYREIIFFQNKHDLDTFKSGNYEFSAQASAVAAESGAASNADYSQGVAVFTMARAGLMFEASVGGQKFSYTPKAQ